MILKQNKPVSVLWFECSALVHRSTFDLRLFVLRHRAAQSRWNESGLHTRLLFQSLHTLSVYLFKWTMCEMNES